MREYVYEAFGVNDAKVQAYRKYNAVVIKNLTYAWKRNGSPDMKKYVIEYMINNDIFSIENAAVVIHTGRGRAYKKFYKPFKSVKRKGRCPVQKTVEIRSRATDKVYYIAKTKTEAVRVAKKLIGEYREDLYGKTVYVAKDEDFVLEYSPPPKAFVGKYYIFIVDAEDVIRYTKHKRRVENYDSSGMVE